MKVTTLTCLFVSTDGRLSIRLMNPPLPPHCEVPTIPPEMAPAARALGLGLEVRIFKRTVEGLLAVYEEV
jgi:hypothetical protein